MAKNKTEIDVTTVFDGELDATDVFVSLIAQKHTRKIDKEYLAIAGCPRTMTLTGRVPVSKTSGICWKSSARSRDGRLWQSIRTMA